MILQLLLFIHNQKSNQNTVSFLARALDMAIDLYMAMAMAKASSHLEMYTLGNSLSR